MPGIDYTTDALVSNIKRRITLPDAQNLYTADDLIAFAGDELSSSIEPIVHSVQQEYWVVQTDVPLVQNQTNYTIPIRGIVNGLRLITLVDSANNEIMFPLLRPENTASSYNWLSPYSTATLCGFTLQDDHIVMFPQTIVTNPTMSVRFRYERQPNQLCATSEAAKVVSIAGNVATVESIPADWTTSLLFDIIKGTPTFVSKGDDLVITAIDTIGLTITFTNAIPTNVVAGDWISVANTSPIAQIPYQMFPYLAQCVAILVLAGMDDEQSLAAAEKTRDKMKEDILKLLQPRDMGNVQTVVNRGGLFESGSYWGWTGGGWNW